MQGALIATADFPGAIELTWLYNRCCSETFFRTAAPSKLGISPPPPRLILALALALVVGALLLFSPGAASEVSADGDEAIISCGDENGTTIGTHTFQWRGLVCEGSATVNQPLRLLVQKPGSNYCQTVISTRDDSSSNRVSNGNRFYLADLGTYYFCVEVRDSDDPYPWVTPGGQGHTLSVTASDGSNCNPQPGFKCPVARTPPAFSGTSATRAVLENSESGYTFGAVITASDTDGDTPTYSLTGTDASKFSISSGGQLSWADSNNNVPSYESNPSDYSITVQATDGVNKYNLPDTKIDDTISVTVSVSDLNEPPGAPTAPTVTASSTTQLSVSWTAPTNTGRPDISDYDVQYRVKNTTNPNTWTSHAFTGTGTSTTIGSLNSSTTYQVQVVAINDECDHDANTTDVPDCNWSASGEGTTSAAPANAAPTFRRRRVHHALRRRKLRGGEQRGRGRQSNGQRWRHAGLLPGRHGWKQVRHRRYLRSDSGENGEHPQLRSQDFVQRPGES